MSSAESEEYPLPERGEGKPYLTLVERDYLSSMGNIPRTVWEPMSLTYEEADQSIIRVKNLDLAPEHEPLRAMILEKWGRVIRWLDEILLKSQSVNALRSWQMVQSLQTHRENSFHPVAGVIPESPGGGKRGLRRRESR